MAEEWEDLFANIRDFDWDPNKRERVSKERGIDLDDAHHVLAGPCLVQRSDRKGEARYEVFGFLADVEVVYVCTLRDDVSWVITARRARRDERKKYHDRLPRPSTPGAGEDQE